MRPIVLTLLLLLAPAAAAQSTIEVIPLRHRTVDQVLPVLRPMLEPGGALSGQMNQLIVRTSPANLAQLRSLLEAIDVPARRLMVSVRFDSARDASRAGVEADARISNRGSRAEVRIEDSRASQSGQAEQRLQVLEGGQAWIATGESRLYSQAQSGFAVVPRISGRTVFLDIAAQQEAFARRGAIQGQRAASTVSGPLGEWIELGGAAGSSAQAGGGLASSHGSTADTSRRIWVKVEEIR